MILATNNKNKLKEIKEIFSDYEITSLKDNNIEIDVEEGGKTFYDNAFKKAKEIYEIAHTPTIADDSGLCITALNDFPGVNTHRFLGEDATDDDKNNYLINKTNEQKNRNCKFICDLVYYDGTNTIVGTGILEGKIAKEQRGNNGFGFDTIFELPSGKTLAELTSIEKNKLSARFLAANDLVKKLKEKDL